MEEKYVSLVCVMHFIHFLELGNQCSISYLHILICYIFFNLQISFVAETLIYYISIFVLWKQMLMIMVPVGAGIAQSV
jgi:hypothetical protein